MVSKPRFLGLKQVDLYWLCSNWKASVVSEISIPWCLNFSSFFSSQVQRRTILRGISGFSSLSSFVYPRNLSVCPPSYPFFSLRGLPVCLPASLFVSPHTCLSARLSVRQYAYCQDPFGTACLSAAFPSGLLQLLHACLLVGIRSSVQPMPFNRGDSDTGMRGNYRS
jgi:hypothetical protein